MKLPNLDVTILCLGCQLENDSPQKWYDEVFSIIRDPSRDSNVRCGFITELARSVLGNEMVRRFLESLVSDDPDSDIRCTSAWALRKAAAEFPHTRALILNRFRDRKVLADGRRRYGRALADSAPIDPDVRKLFLGFLEDDSEPIEIKVAAAAGLAFVTLSDDNVRRILVELLESEQTPSRLREGMRVFHWDRRSDMIPGLTTR